MCYYAYILQCFIDFPTDFKGKNYPKFFNLYSGIKSSFHSLLTRAPIVAI